MNISFQHPISDLFVSLFLAEEERNCIDPSGRLLFRKPKEKTDDVPTKSDIVDVASNKNLKRKPAAAASTADKDCDDTKKKAKTQLLSFMDESGFDGDD
jgi:hypothetical protein